MLAKIFVEDVLFIVALTCLSADGPISPAVQVVVVAVETWGRERGISVSSRCVCSRSILAWESLHKLVLRIFYSLFYINNAKNKHIIVERE